MGIAVQGGTTGNVAEVTALNAVRVFQSPVNVGALGSVFAVYGRIVASTTIAPKT